MGYDFADERKGAPEGGSGSSVTAGDRDDERSESARSPAVTLRGRAGGVATLHADKTPRPTDEGAIFAPAKIVTESFPARQNILRVDKTPRPTSEGAIFAPAKIVPELFPPD